MCTRKSPLNGCNDSLAQTRPPLFPLHLPAKLTQKGHKDRRAHELTFKLFRTALSLSVTSLTTTYKGAKAFLRGEETEGTAQNKYKLKAVNGFPTTQFRLQPIHNIFYFLYFGNKLSSIPLTGCVNS